jgi:hypothetical protein
VAIIVLASAPDVLERSRAHRGVAVMRGTEWRPIIAADCIASPVAHDDSPLTKDALDRGAHVDPPEQQTEAEVEHLVDAATATWPTGTAYGRQNWWTCAGIR